MSDFSERRRALHLVLALMVVAAALVVLPPHGVAEAATGDAGITIDGDKSDWLGNPAVSTTPDPCDSSDDDRFKGGTKFEDVLDAGTIEPVLVNQKSASKGDLCEAQSASEVNDAGDIILFLSWTRFSSTGEVKVYIPFGDGDGTLEPGEFVLRYDYDSSAKTISVFTVDADGNATPIDGANAVSYTHLTLPTKIV